jgi:hypothetical protein
MTSRRDGHDIKDALRKSKACDHMLPVIRKRILNLNPLSKFFWWYLQYPAAQSAYGDVVDLLAYPLEQEEMQVEIWSWLFEHPTTHFHRASETTAHRFDQEEALLVYTLYTYGDFLQTIRSFEHTDK